MAESDEVTILADAVEELVDAKVRRQNGISTYYDHYLRRAVATVRSAGDDAGTVVGTKAHRALETFLSLVSGPRFQDPRPRLERTDNQVLAAMAVGLQSFVATQGVKDHLSWRSRPLYKTAFDLAAYPMLIGELAPRTVIELGSGSGASAVWIADIACAHAMKPRIISIDRATVVSSDERVMFLTGDVARLADLLPEELTAGLPRPWLVLEDAHAHVDDVLDFFDAHLTPGDYMIIEDSFSKRAALRAFLDRAANTYQLDTKYVDLFGENTTCAIDAIFRRQ